MKKKFVTLTRHVLRSVCPNGSQKHMHLTCFTTNQKWLICVLPAKTYIYRYFSYVSVILRSGCTLQCAILPIFVLRFYYDPPRALIRTPSCTIRSTKCTMTEFTSKNANFLTLNPYNFFLAGYWFTKFMWDAYICI